MTVARALISVSDKTGLVEFARGLSALGIEILSTGGTASLLVKEGIKVLQVTDFTGAPEMFGGRVKTLHPKVHGGILARRKLAGDQADMQRQGIQPIDLVVVNLYPFREAVAKGLPYEEVIENIDIGGPSMVRSAAKNADYVTVVVDPADYGVVLAELQQKREVHESTRRRLQARAYAHTAAYDAAISGWLAEQLARAHPEEGGGFAESPPLPEYRRRQSLRYGENPHQRAAFYVAVPQPREPTLASARQLQGKELSYNNLLDQSRDLADADPRGWKVVTHRAPTPDEIEALSFAWSVVKHVKSNAIVLARRDVTVGIGMGQTNRVDSVRIAAQRAGEKARGAVLGSDAFFPFPDGVEEAARAGVTAIAQPGGSVRDDEVIAAADRSDLAMVFTGVRHFRH